MADAVWTHKSLIFAVIIMVMLPMTLTVVCPSHAIDVSEDEVLDGYYEMTGQQASTKVSVWPLTGIYTPYSGGSYGWTEDGWLYGSEVKTYKPTQYRSTSEEYTVVKGDDGVFRYQSNTSDYSADNGTGHAAGDLYTMVNFDTSQQSSVFFTESGRTDTDDGHFYYQYDGYRLAFQPISNYTTENEDGERVPIIATTTSLSLIWYHYYTQSGVAGMLVLSGSSGGTSYLNAAQIVSAFSNATSTASFSMVFNGGIDMDIYIRIDPSYLAQGYTVAECYNLGYWSIMVTSLSADSSAYTGTDSAITFEKLFDTVVALFTFDTDKFNLSPMLSSVCSVIFILPLYLMLITYATENWKTFIIIGILAAIQSFSIFGI